MKKTIFSLIAACMAFVSCDLIDDITGGKDKDTIVGTWESTSISLIYDGETVTMGPDEVKMVWEFKEDGTYVQTNYNYDKDGNESSDPAQNGTYKTEGAKITITQEGKDARTGDYVLKSDVLELTLPVIEGSVMKITLARK